MGLPPVTSTIRAPTTNAKITELVGMAMTRPRLMRRSIQIEVGGPACSPAGAVGAAIKASFLAMIVRKGCVRRGRDRPEGGRLGNRSRKRIWHCARDAGSHYA